MYSTSTKTLGNNKSRCKEKNCQIFLCSINRLAEARSELDQVMKMLKEKQDSLAAIEAKIAELQKTYDESVAEKQKLERSIAQTAARLKRSAKLTTALADEQIRWDESVKVSCTVKPAHVVTCI